LVARRRVFGAHLDGGAGVLELKVAAIPIEAVVVAVEEQEEVTEEVVVVEEVSVVIEVVEVSVLTELGDTYLVLSVAGVGYSLQPHSLVGVVSPTGYVNRLVDVAAVGILLDVTEATVKAEPIESAVIKEEVTEVVVVVVVVAMVCHSGGSESYHHGHHHGQYSKNQFSASHEGTTSLLSGEAQ